MSAPLKASRLLVHAGGPQSETWWRDEFATLEVDSMDNHAENTAKSQH